MRSPEEHRAEIAKLLTQPATEEVPIAQAAGRVLAQEVEARWDSPRFDNSQMDGYALSPELLPQLPATVQVGPTIAAGTDPASIYPQGITNHAAPIMTGAKIPKNTAAIVPVEKCDPPTFDNNGAITVPKTAHGQFIRAAGSDIKAGQPLLAKGTTLTPAAVATLAGQGLDTVTVRARARIIIVTGGAEIGEAGPATIPDANAPMFQALAHRYGIDIVGHVRTNDEPEQLREELTDAVGKHAPDAIVTSGGISHGKFEVVRLALEGWFGHVAQQPGGPQGLAEIAGVPVLCLPGNPVSTLVSFRLFVAPALGQAPEPVAAVLNENRTGLADARTQFLRGRLWVDDNAQVRAAGIGGPGSHLIAQATEANALLAIPPRAQLQAGDTITAYPL